MNALVGDVTNSPEQNRQKAMDHAWSISRLMTMQSAAKNEKTSAQNLWNELAGDRNKKPGQRESTLGGAFLRMYLKNEVDPEVTREAGADIGRSTEFHQLQTLLRNHILSKRKHLEKSTPDTLAERLRAISDAYLKQRRRKPGIAFRKSGLNPVIGGVGGSIDVDRVAISTNVTDAGIRVDYIVDVRIGDTYDFQNKRTGEYQRYRQLLARLLKQDRYREFWTSYARESIGVGNITKLPPAAVFASFMYAIESKGWTPDPVTRPLTWDTTVPITGSLVLPRRETHPPAPGRRRVP
ncbi:hypothetical protein [Streptomyces sp. Tu102]|uniref:hypothetical protein n=1 Tax=Streptomyces sp. Tu102 TaxID=2838019 RepID=UPI001BDCA766|nr:hypothetical protein [Streptomyces sp. Tu102]MBT1090310.1 hypothetical protein [Streptomyces sp. Tu102]